jgi:hypothetical protein
MKAVCDFRQARWDYAQIINIKVISRHLKHPGDISSSKSKFMLLSIIRSVLLVMLMSRLVRT